MMEAAGMNQSFEIFVLSLLLFFMRAYQAEICMNRHDSFIGMVLSFS